MNVGVTPSLTLPLKGGGDQFSSPSLSTGEGWVGVTVIPTSIGTGPRVATARCLIAVEALDSHIEVNGVIAYERATA